MLELALILQLAVATADPTVFGLPLSAPLDLPKCRKNSIAFVNPDKGLCFAPSDSEILFAYSEVPNFVRGFKVDATVVGGKLEGVMFDTSGLASGELVLEELKAKYGEPTSLERQAEPDLPASAPQLVHAEWDIEGRGVYVTFVSRMAPLSNGFVSIRTNTGRQAHEEAAARMRKGKRQL